MIGWVPCQNNNKNNNNKTTIITPYFQAQAASLFWNSYGPVVLNMRHNNWCFPMALEVRITITITTTATIRTSKTKTTTT